MVDLGSKTPKTTIGLMPGRDLKLGKNNYKTGGKTLEVPVVAFSRDHTTLFAPQKGCGGLGGENPGAFPKAEPIFQQPFSPHRKVPKPWQG